MDASSNLVFLGFQQMLADAAQQVVEHLKSQNSIESLTAHEVAEALRINDVKAVYDLDIPKFYPYGEGSRAVRFLKSDVLEYIRKNRVEVEKERIGKTNNVKKIELRKVA